MKPTRPQGRAASTCSLEARRAARLAALLVAERARAVAQRHGIQRIDGGGIPDFYCVAGNLRLRYREQPHEVLIVEWLHRVVLRAFGGEVTAFEPGPWLDRLQMLEAQG
jgi:hypothetical protein